MKHVLLTFLISIFFISCSLKQVNIAKSATIIFKTSSMKFYDKGFINKYDAYINLQIYNFGNIALNLDIYPTQVCKSTLECLSAKEFNKKYLSENYKEDFLYSLFKKDIINFKDKTNNIFIKVKYDKMPS